jgi:Mrp family chromosome partitioning ATPase
MALGLFVGIAVGFGLAFTFEYFNHKIRTTEDVQNTFNIQNVLSIPPVDTTKLAQSLKQKARLEDKELVLPAKAMSQNVTVWLYMIPEIRECFESIKSQLYGEMGKSTKERPSNSPYVLGVTSSYRGEGVSSVALGIAYTISLYEGENVLLVDSNLHNPYEEKIIGENRPPGLYEVTVSRDGSKSKIIDKEKEDDSFFSVKSMDEYLSQQDGSQQINKLLPSVEKLNYKVIVIDLPSIGEGVAALKSSAISDGIIYVIESERIRREVVKHAKEKLDNAGVKIFGIVLNKRRYYIPKWLYNRL